MTMRLVMLWIFLAGNVFFVGCGDRDTRAEVAGEVAFNGQPVQAGMLSFEPSAGDAPAQNVAIEDGRYSTALEPGSYLVRITAADLEKMGPPLEDTHAPQPDYVPLLPQQWNTQSRLTVEVKPGRNTLHFRGNKGEEPAVEEGTAGN